LPLLGKPCLRNEYKGTFLSSSFLEIQIILNLRLPFPERQFFTIIKMQIEALSMIIGLTALVSSIALPDPIAVANPVAQTTAPTPSFCNPGTFRCQGKSIVGSSIHEQSLASV